MTNEVKLFNNEMFGEVRVVMKEDKAWFVASDVANALGIKLSTDMARTLDEDEKDKYRIHTRGGEQKVIIINESGLITACSGRPKGKELLNFLMVEDKIIIKPRKEYTFGEDIIYNLFGDYIIIPQYSVLGGKYIIDWYIPQLKIAIEFDEDYHKATIEHDQKRQREIEEHLQCNFIRYKDYRKF